MKCKNAILLLLIGFSVMLANEAGAVRIAGNGRSADSPLDAQHQEPFDDMRQGRKTAQEEFGKDVKERAKDRGITRKGTRPNEADAGRELRLMPEERMIYQDQYRELREERKGLRDRRNDFDSGRGGRAQGKNR
jgi:hypothetical protein